MKLILMPPGISCCPLAPSVPPPLHTCPEDEWSTHYPWVPLTGARISDSQRSGTSQDTPKRQSERPSRGKGGWRKIETFEAGDGDEHGKERVRASEGEITNVTWVKKCWGVINGRSELVYYNVGRGAEDEVKKRLGIPRERNEEQMENEAQGACAGC